MAFALLDGTSSTIDASITPPGGSPTSAKTWAAAWTARITREFFEQTVFANNGFRARIGGMKQSFISLAGFMSQGSPLSDPLALFASQTPCATVLTAFTACTITGNYQYGSDENSLVAGGNSGRVVAGESYGSFSTSWVVA